MAITKIVDDVRTTTAIDATKLTGTIAVGRLDNAPTQLGFSNVSGWADSAVKLVTLSTPASAIGKAQVAVYEEVSAANKTNASWDISTNDTGFNLIDSAYTQTLTPAATTGSSIAFTMGGGSWVTADIGKRIVNVSTSEAGVAKIISIAGTVATCIITTTFTDTNAIASGDWELYSAEFVDGAFKLSNATQTGAGTPGTATVFESAAITGGIIIALTTTKSIVWYSDVGNSSYGTACILDVSGTTVTAGTPFVFKSGNTDSPNYKNSMTKLTDSKVLVVYKDHGNGGTGTAVVLEISGTSITAGSTTNLISSGPSINMASVSALNSTKVIVTYKQANYPSYGEAVCLSISGTTITAGTPINFHTGANATLDPVVCALSETKAIVVWGDGDASAVGTAQVLTISGTTVTAGAEATWPDDPSKKSIIKLSETKAIVVYYDSDNSDYGAAVVLSMSGTTITAGTPIVYDSTGSASASAHSAVLIDTDRVLVVYSRSTGKFCVLSISGTTITGATPVQFATATDYQHVAATGTDAIISYKDTSNTYGTALVVSFESPLYLTNQYVTTISGTDSVDTTYYSDWNSNTITETLGGQSAYYAFSVNSTPSAAEVTGGTFLVVGSGQTATRNIVSSLSAVHGGTAGVWYKNTHATYGSETWAAATTNEAKAAIQEATATAANQMNSTAFAAISDANLPAFGTQLSMAMTLYSTSTAATPSIDGVSFNYDGNVINRLETDAYTVEMPSAASIQVTAPSSGGPRNARIFVS